MTNKELAAQCLIEAAGLLNESYGANGAAKKFYDEKIKRDEKIIKDNEKKAKMYERAGYADKGPGKIVEEAKSRIEENKKKRSYVDTHNRMNDNSQYFSNKDRARASRNGTYNTDYYDTSVNQDYAKAYKSTPERNKLYYGNAASIKHKKLHERINERAKKSNNETIDIVSLLREAADLLDEE